MRFDLSWGRHKSPAVRPSWVAIAPGWWRLEWGPLALEIDDQPTEWGPAVLRTSVVVAILFCSSVYHWSLS